MRQQHPFSLFARARSFGHAARGLASLPVREHNARIHAVATAVVIAAGVAARLERWEWAAVLLATGLVWGAEALNAALEVLADLIEPKPRPSIGLAKDLGAGGVLAAALTAAAVGLLVFGPRLLGLVGWP